MAPVVVQTAKNAATGASTTVTLGSPTTPGNCLVAEVISAGTSTNPTVSGITLGGSAGNWGVVATEGNSGDHAVSTSWADPACAGSQTSVVVSLTGGSGTLAALVWVYEVSGMPALIAGMLDKSAVLSSAGFVSSWTLGPTATTTQASEICFGLAGGNTNNTTVATYTPPGTLWTNQAQQGLANVGGSGFSFGGVCGYQILGATGTVSYNGTVSPTSTIEGLVVTLKASTAVAAAVPAPYVSQNSGMF